MPLEYNAVNTVPTSVNPFVRCALRRGALLSTASARLCRALFTLQNILPLLVYLNMHSTSLVKCRH